MVKLSVLTYAPYAPSRAASTLGKSPMLPGATSCLASQSSQVTKDLLTVNDFDSLAGEFLGARTLRITSQCSHGVR